MKKLLILTIILSFCYSQNDNPNNEFNKQTTKSMIQNYKIIKSNGMELIVESYILTGSGRIRLNDDRNREYPLYQIEKIIDLKNGEIVWKEGMHTESKVKSYDGIGKPIGGLFIAAGGAFLYSNIDKEINDGETIEDFIDRVNGTAKLGYALITIGGFLVSMGI